MTGTQLTLADCDPTWADLTPSRTGRTTRASKPRLLDHTQMRDLHGQHITRSHKHRIVDVPIVGNWL